MYKNIKSVKIKLNTKCCHKDNLLQSKENTSTLLGADPTHLDAWEGLLEGVEHCQVGLEVSVGHWVVGSLLCFSFTLLMQVGSLSDIINLLIISASIREVHQQSSPE